VARAVVVALSLCAVLGAFVSVKWLLPLRIASNEAKAVGELRTMTTAQALFREGDKDKNGVLDYATSLRALADPGLVDRALGSGTKEGYLFAIVAADERRWAATATPDWPGWSGSRAFFVDETGTTRWRPSPHGEAATRDDPEVGQPQPEDLQDRPRAPAPAPPPPGAAALGDELPEPVSALRFAPDGRSLVTAGADGWVRVWDVASRAQTRTVWCGGAVHALAPDASLAVTTGPDLAVVDVATGRVAFSRPTRVACAEIAPGGATLAIVDSDGAVRLLDARSGLEVRRLPQIAGTACLAFSPDGKALAAGSRPLWIADVATGRELVRAPFLGDVIAFSPDGKLLAKGDGAWIRVASTDAIERPRATLQCQHAVRAIAFSPDGATLASGDRKLFAAPGHEAAAVRLWDIASGKERLVIEVAMPSVGALVAAPGPVFSPDGGTLAVSDGKRIRLFDVATGRDVTRAP
jgi:hypothetical protein